MPGKLHRVAGFGLFFAEPQGRGLGVETFSPRNGKPQAHRALASGGLHRGGRGVSAAAGLPISDRRATRAGGCTPRNAGGTLSPNS
jgi:hypothetical protein